MRSSVSRYPSDPWPDPGYPSLLFMERAELRSPVRTSVALWISKGGWLCDTSMVLGCPEAYPLNSNSNPRGMTGVHTPDGRVLALMPHPERVTTLQSNSWYPESVKEGWGGSGPWLKLFQTRAREWIG